MKTVQTETDHAPKQRRYRFWSRFALSLGLGMLIYYAYCWGLWGRNSLLLQYIFQCGCPVSSEETRYPKQVDVVVPACRYDVTRLSPSGRLLYVGRKVLWNDTSYLLDLQTDEKIAFAIPEGSNRFLTDDLLFLSLDYGHRYEGGEYILDRTTGKQYPIRKFVYWRPDAYVNGKANLSVLVEGLREAKQVFLISDGDTIVTLAPDFRIYPEHNFLTGWFDIPRDASSGVEYFLQENNIVYQTILANFPGEVVSPDGKFVARYDGIYLVETNQKIVEGYPDGGGYLSVRGWAYDGREAIYSQPILGPCLIKTNFFIFDDTGCFFEVPQPVLMLEVPPEYLPPAP